MKASTTLQITNHARENNLISRCPQSLPVKEKRKRINDSRISPRNEEELQHQLLTNGPPPTFLGAN